MLSTQYYMIEEARKTNRGSKFPIELLKIVLVSFVMICITGIISEVASALILKNGGAFGKDVVILYSEVFGIAITILYCVKIERRSVQSVGFRKPWVKEYAIGMFFGAGMFSIVVLIGTISGGFRFCFFNRGVNIVTQLLLLGGFLIQGMSEEVLCRGFAFVSLSRKNSVLWACIGNAILFSLMHIFNEGFSIIPFINLVLFGIFETLIVMKTNKIWMASAIHSIWNYMQGCVFGFKVSGDDIGNAFCSFQQSEFTLMSGGAFGPEGGLPVTITLLCGVTFLLWDMQIFRGENRKNREVSKKI